MCEVQARLERLERRLQELEDEKAELALLVSSAEEAVRQRDRTAVLDRLHRLQVAIDRRDWGTVRATFTSDATGYGRTGVDDIVAVMQDHLGGCGPTQHLVGNPRVSVVGDRARSRCYARVYHLGAGSKNGAFYECMGDYDDEWVRTGSGWRLSHRTFDVRLEIGDFGVLRPRPGADSLRG